MKKKMIIPFPSYIMQSSNSTLVLPILLSPIQIYIKIFIDIINHKKANTKGISTFCIGFSHWSN